MTTVIYEISAANIFCDVSRRRSGRNSGRYGKMAAESFRRIRRRSSRRSKGPAGC
jgi:hypothetical protein